jgi:hypothetical protein
VFDQFNLLYARLGFDCSRDKVSFKAGTSGNAHISKQTLGFISGFGFEHKWHAVVAGIEYSYAMGRKIKGNLALAPLGPSV